MTFPATPQISPGQLTPTQSLAMTRSHKISETFS